MSEVHSIKANAPLPLPKRFEKKIQRDKAVRIALGVFTCGISVGIRAGVRRFKVAVLNKTLLPAAYKDTSKLPKIKGDGVSYPPIVTVDGIKLDAMVYEVNPSNKKWLVYFCGNGMFYQDAFDQLKEIADDTKSNILVFNYQGINSKGRAVNFTDLLKSGAACMEYLRQKRHVHRKDITLWGFSLGGAVATRLRRYYKGCKIFNCLSFGNSLKATFHMLGGGIPGTIGLVVVLITASSVHAGKDWKRIPSADKILAFHPRDGVIKTPASLFQYEKKRGTHKNYPCIKLKGGKRHISRHNHVTLYPESKQQIVLALKKLMKT